MDLGINGFLDRFKQHYDKVMAFFVLLALVVSLVLLVVKLNMLKQVDAEFESWLRGLRPQNPEAVAVKPAAYEAALAALETPVQLEVPSTDQTNSVWLFVPETRFNCRECRHPVEISAEACPFCSAPVTPPEDEPLDHDEDGMYSDWERQYGFDPFDATDAAKDFDGDGYTNLDEYTAKTNPRDPNSRPPAVGRLKLDKISGTQFGLRFNSRVRTRSGFKFGLNYRLPSGEIRTEFVKIGDTVEGFKVDSYEEKEEPAKTPSMGKVDVSELTLISPRGDPIILVMNRPVRYVELVASLSIELRGELQRFDVQKGDPLELDGRTYSVIDVDAKARSVIIKGEGAESVMTIRQR
jgi:hypothetical protein